MSQLFGAGSVPQSVIPPPSPSRIDTPIQKAGDAVLQNRARQGAASQFLTSSLLAPSGVKASQRYLGGNDARQL